MATRDETMNMDENMNIDVDDADDVQSQSSENENDTVEQPARKRYKNAFKQSAADRRLYDRRNLTALDRKLNEWYRLTKCPTVALTLVGGHIQYSGPPQFRPFASDDAVQSVFGSIVLNQSNDVSGTTSEDFSAIQLPDDWREFNVFSKRKLIIALVTNNGTRNANWRTRTRPVWWPESIPFGDPNNSKPRLSAGHLHTIIEGYSSFMVSSGHNDAGVGNSGFGVSGGDDGVGRGNDSVGGVNDDAGDDDVGVDGGNADGGANDGVDGGDNGGGDADGFGANDGVDGGDNGVDGADADGGGADCGSAEVVYCDCDNSADGGDNSVASGGGDGAGGGDDGVAGDLGETSTCSERVVEMRNVLRSCTIYMEEDQRRILGFLKGVNNWAEFLSCIELVKEKGPLLPSYEQPVGDQQYTQTCDVEKSVRCDVPKGVLKEGLEPVKVTADGNCLFRSISKVITGSEDDHLLFKLAVVVHGCSNEQHYQKNIHYLINDDLDLFLHTVTEDGILATMSEDLSEKDKFMHVYRQEVMRTVIDGRYSGYLQVLMMADTLQRRIIQHCNAPGMDLYNTEVIPLHIPPNISAIHILWCSLSGSGIQNHIVPLQKCRDENAFNTFSKSFDGVCGPFCQFEIDLESGKQSQWIACDRCLLWFHYRCVFFRTRKLGKSWSCGCSTPDDEISSCQINLTPDGLETFCKDRLQAFVRDIVKGKIKSRRFDYLKRGSPNSLKRAAGLVMDNDDTIEILLFKLLDQVMERSDCWPPDVERSRRNIVSFKLDILTTEIAIWMMSSTSNVSRFRSEEVHDTFNPN